MTHWAEAYATKDWVPSNDPKGRPKYDCWDHVREVQREVFGRELDEIDPENYDIWALIKMLKENSEIGKWKQVDKPSEGDIVQLGHAKRPHHVGTWTKADGGKVVHCLEKAGVVAQSKLTLRMSGWGHLTFWTPK